MKFSLNKYNLRSKVETAKKMGKVIYEIVRSSLWPLYSTAILASAFHLLCASSEKQILADHYFGDTKKFNEEKDTLVADSKKMFQEELSTTIKERVWQLPEHIVRYEYKERHIA